MCVTSTLAPLGKSMCGSPLSITEHPSPYIFLNSSRIPPPDFKSPRLLRRKQARNLPSREGSAHMNTAAAVLCVTIKSSMIYRCILSSIHMHLASHLSTFLMDFILTCLLLVSSSDIVTTHSPLSLSSLMATIPKLLQMNTRSSANCQYGMVSNISPLGNLLPYVEITFFRIVFLSSMLPQRHSLGMNLTYLPHISNDDTS